MEEPHDRGSIEPQSRRDRAAIGERQRRNHLQTIGRRPTSDQDDDCGSIVARSRPNHGPIVARLCQNLWPFRSEIQAPSPRIWSHKAMQRKPLPRRLKTALTTCSITHDSKPNFLFKSMYFPSLVLQLLIDS